SVHVSALADEQLPSLMRLFDLELEACGIDGVPGLGSFCGQPLERPFASPPHPLLFFDRAAGLGQALLEMADDGGGLEADATGAQRLGDQRQLSQLLADTEPVRSRVLGKLALLGDPACRAVAGQEMLFAPAGRGNDPAELALQAVDDCGQTTGVD